MNAVTLLTPTVQTGEASPHYPPAALAQASLDCLSVFSQRLELDVFEIFFGDCHREVTRLIINESTYLIDGRVLHYVATHFPNLKELHLRTRFQSNNEITDEDLENLARKKPNLKAVTIKHCPRVTAEGLLTFIKIFQNLRKFSTDLECFDNRHAAAIAQLNIKKLTIAGNNGMCIFGIFNIATAAKCLRSFTVVVNDIVYQDELDELVITLTNRNVKSYIRIVPQDDDPPFGGNTIVIKRVQIMKG